MNKKQKILILGAGKYQLPLIKKAKEMGLFIIVVSIRGNYPGFEFADKVYFVSTTDSEKVLEIAKFEKIDAVCTSGTDVALRTLGVVCDFLKLPGITKDTAELSTNKRLMKEAFRIGNVNTPKFRVVSTLNDCLAVYDEFNKPLIFKALDSSGSRGIIKVKHREEISRAIEYVYQTTNLSSFIIEEFIDGLEFGVQTAVINGELQFIMPHGDILFHGKTNVPIGYYVPLKISSEIMGKIEEQIDFSIKALSLNTCAINADFILKNNEVFVLEVGARAGATCLPELVSEYYGFDYYQYLLKMSLGEKVEFPQKSGSPCGNLIYCSKKSGIFNSIQINNREQYQIIEEVFDYEKGDEIKNFEVGIDRVGHVVIKGNSEYEVIKKLNQLISDINIVLE